MFPCFYILYMIYAAEADASRLVLRLIEKSTFLARAAGAWYLVFQKDASARMALVERSARPGTPGRGLVKGVASH
jgi:hypothetical protein